MTSPAFPGLLRWFRGHRRLLLGMTLLAVATTAIAFFVMRPRAAPPMPPQGNLDEMEPAVAALVQEMHGRVLKEPRSGEAWGKLGEVFYANDRNEESEVCFVQAERLDPANPRWPYLQAGIRINQGDRDGAVALLQRALERCDAEDAPPARLLLGETLLFLDRLDEAEVSFRKALASQPQIPRAHFDLGLLAIARQDWKTARDHLFHCLSSPTSRKKARVQLAMVCRRLGDAKSAGEFHEEANRLPADADWVDPFVLSYMRWAVKKRARYRQVEQLETAQRFAESVAVLQPMTEEFPADYLPHLTLGKMLGRMGQLARAESELRLSLRLAPDKIQPFYYLSLILFLQAEGLSGQKNPDPDRVRALYQESADLAKQALALQPNNGLAHMSRGRALGRLGKRAEAIAELRQAVGCNPEYAELHFYLGEALAEEGQAAEARTRLEHALRLADADVAWRQKARDCLAGLGGRKK